MLMCAIITCARSNCNANGKRKMGMTEHDDDFKKDFYSSGPVAKDSQFMK